MSCGYLLEFDDVSELIRLHYNLQEYTHKVMMSQARKICDRKECPLDTKESAGTPTNSDYAAALKLYLSYRETVALADMPFSFEDWCKQRLNSAKAPNCA
jgi:hypothetical protein